MKRFHTTVQWIITIIILTLLNTPTLQAQIFRLNVYDELIPESTHPDSRIQVLHTRYQKCLTEKDTTTTTTMIKCLISMSSLNRSNLNVNTALENVGKAVFLAEKYKEPVLLATAHEEFGALYCNFRQDEIAGQHFINSHNITKKPLKKDLSANRSYTKLTTTWHSTTEG